MEVPFAVTPPDNTATDYPLPGNLLRSSVPRLWEVLEHAQGVGALGNAPVIAHIWHASVFADVAARAGVELRGPVLDLGSGGGVPGLVLAHLWPDRDFLLLDGSRRRTALLHEAVSTCGLSDRVTVQCDRAEVAAHLPALRSMFSLVVSRAFGPPPVVAECASGFLQPGGLLVVSEPPEGSADRWPKEQLAEVGLVPLGRVEDPLHFQVLLQESLCPERFPRRTGIPTKRPIYRVD